MFNSFGVFRGDLVREIVLRHLKLLSVLFLGKVQKGFDCKYFVKCLRSASVTCDIKVLKGVPIIWIILGYLNLF